MIPLKKSLSLALGLVVLATVAVLITTSTVGASPRLNPIAAAPPPPSVPVTVVNTPLPVTGTVNANVTGAVNATLTNASINVGNPATSPVLVRDVDNGQRPYQQTLFMTATGGSTPDPGCSSIAQCEANITVPPGTRFVVEHVSVWVQGQGGQKYIAALKGNTANFVVLNFQGTFHPRRFHRQRCDARLRRWQHTAPVRIRDQYQRASLHRRIRDFRLSRQPATMSRVPHPDLSRSLRKIRVGIFRRLPSSSLVVPTAKRSGGGRNLLSPRVGSVPVGRYERHSRVPPS